MATFCYFVNLLLASKSKVKWCIYTCITFSTWRCSTRRLLPADQKHAHTGTSGSHIKVVHVCRYSLFLLTPEGWKAEQTLVGKKVTQIFNPWPGRRLNEDLRIGRQRFYMYYYANPSSSCCPKKVHVLLSIDSENVLDWDPRGTGEW